MTQQIKAAHILVMHKDSMRSTATRTREEALEMINDIQGQLGGGGDFGALAKQHSDCPSGGQGGDLGGFGRKQMVKEFEDAAFALDVGATSAVVETPFGFHLIRRTG